MWNNPWEQSVHVLRDFPEEREAEAQIVHVSAIASHHDGPLAGAASAQTTRRLGCGLAPASSAAYTAKHRRRTSAQACGICACAVDLMGGTPRYAISGILAETRRHGCIHIVSKVYTRSASIAFRACRRFSASRLCSSDEPHQPFVELAPGVLR